MELNKSIKKAWQFRNYTEIAMFTFYLKEKKKLQAWRFIFKSITQVCVYKNDGGEKKE